MREKETERQRESEKKRRGTEREWNSEIKRGVKEERESEERKKNLLTFLKKRKFWFSPRKRENSLMQKFLSFHS